MRKFQLYKIKQFADSLEHCGDYGTVHIKNDLSEVYITLSDADENDLEEFENYVKCLGVKFTVEAECGPDIRDGYTLVSNGIEVENFYTGDDPIEDGYIIPKPLSLDEYSDYLRILRTLEN